MSFPSYATLDEIRTEVIARLGMAAVASPSSHINTHITYIIQDAQKQVIEDFDDELLRTIDTTDPGATVIGQILYDIPNACDPQRIVSVSVAYGTSWQPIDKGISAVMRDSAYTSSHPSAWDVRYGTTTQPQLEFWPEPTQATNIQLEYYRRAGSFTLDTDVASVDDTIIKLLALANAKAHYGQADAATIGAQYQKRLGQFRAKQHRNNRYPVRVARASTRSETTSFPASWSGDTVTRRID